MIKRIHALLSSRYVFRDSGTGEFVSKAYALLHPLTTERQKVWRRDHGDIL